MWSRGQTGGNADRRLGGGPVEPVGASRSGTLIRDFARIGDELDRPAVHPINDRWIDGDQREVERGDRQRRTGFDGCCRYVHGDLEIKRRYEFLHDIWG